MAALRCHRQINPPEKNRMFGVAEKWPSKPFMKASDGFENFLKTIVAWAGGFLFEPAKNKRGIADYGDDELSLLCFWVLALPPLLKRVRGKQCGIT